MQEQPKDIKLAFLEVLERETPEERRDYLDRICRENPDWRVELESLLKTHDEAGHTQNEYWHPSYPYRRRHGRRNRAHRGRLASAATASTCDPRDRSEDAR